MKADVINSLECTTPDAPPRVRPIRVLIVEDSHSIRELLNQVISDDPRFTIVGNVESGERAIAVLPDATPDVITMDIRLPGMDGFETTRQIMAHRPTPIVVVAADVNQADLRISFNALRAGALSVVEKPGGLSNGAVGLFAKQLCTQLAIMSEVRVITQRANPHSPSIAPARPIRRTPANATHTMVGIVASTGGPNALVQVLGSLEADFRAPILLVQHMTSCFAKAFVEWLDDMCSLRVVEACERQRPEPGSVYVAPADRHLVLRAGRLHLDPRPPISLQRPSGTLLLQSMASDLGPSAVGVLLTGMGDDGAMGLRDIRAAGGHTIAEHESTAVVYGMPGAAVALSAVCESLPLPLIAPRLLDLVGAPTEIAP